MKIEKISFYSLVVLICLTPIIFISPGFLLPDYAKVGFAVVCILISALSTVSVFWQKKAITISKHPIVISLIAIDLVAVLSAIVVGVFKISFFGQGVELGTVSILLLMSLVLLLVIATARDVGRLLTIYIALLASFAVVFLYHLLRLFIGPDFLSFGAFDQITSTIIGRWHELSIFGGLVLVILVTSLEYLTLRPLVKWLVGIGGLLTILLMTLSGFTGLWIAVGIIMLFIVVSKFFSQHSLATYALVIGIIAGVFVFAPANTVGRAMNYFGITENEIALPWQTTVDIAAGTIKSAPLLGAGPNQFVVAFNVFKPQYLNNTQAWSFDFMYGVGIVPTLAITCGLLGIIAWIVFLWLILRSGVGISQLKSKDETNVSLHESQIQYVLVSSFLGTVFMWFIAILYVPSFSLWLITFVITAVYVGAISNVDKKNVTLGWDLSSKKGKVMSILVVVVAIALVLWGVLFLRSTIAQVYFQSGAKSTSVDVAESKFNKAIDWHDTDIYERALATAYVIHFQNFISEKTSNGAQLTATDTEMIAPVIKAAVDASDRAIAVNSSNYINYLSKAKVLGILAQAKVDKAHETAVALYEQAATLSPNNPAIYYEAGLLETNLGNAEQAQKYFMGAIQMKSDYVDAVAMLGSLLYQNKSFENAEAAFSRVIELNPNYQNIHYFKALALVGSNKVTEAIAELELAAKANPNEPIISKYLEELKTQRTLPTKTADLPLTASSTPVSKKK